MSIPPKMFETNGSNRSGKMIAQHPSLTPPSQGYPRVKDSSVFEILTCAIDEALLHQGIFDLYLKLPEPTPIDTLGIRIVHEIKLGSVWIADDSSTRMFKQLFQEKEEPTFCLNDVNLFQVDQTGEDLQEESDSVPPIGALYMQEKWNDRFDELLQYRKVHGNCLVPHNWKDNRGLAQWVKRQRYQYKLKGEGKHTTLTSERIGALDAVGFVWSSHNTSWEERYLDLVEFAARHGHCNVSSRFQQNPQLSVWVRCQRRQYKISLRGSKSSTMTTTRYQKLKELGFVFNPRNLKA
jgi:hypothetical protein